jgi:serine/threonine protein kinase
MSVLKSGTVLQNRYSIIQFIGQGGMAAVYLGADVRLGNRYVAIKQMNPANLGPADQQWAVTAFQQEAEVLARLNHPTIARVIDFFQEEAFWYLVMEYVDGESLDAALNRYPQGLAEAQVLIWASQLGGALEYLHQQYPPVIFRDLKPGNVMVQPDGTLKLIDFGIARYFKPGQNQDTVRLGTPGYAAPEQYGRGQTDARSEVFSFGVLLHQLLTGYDPTLTPMNLPPVRSLRPDISVRVAQAVEQAMQAAPGRRYGSIREFAAALGISISGILGLSNAPPAPPTSPSERLKVIPPLVLVGIGAFAVAFLFLFTWFMLSLRNGSTSIISNNPTSLDSITIEITQIVTPTPDSNEGIGERFSESEMTSIQSPALNSTTTSLPVPTETPLPPSATPTETLPPPTATFTPLPTFTPPPTLTATPAVAACGYSVSSSFASTHQNYQSQLGCPTSNAWTTWSAKEAFERGYMFWRQDNRKIYVLYNNGNWARYDDIWSEGEPSFTCGAPQSPPTPQRGFGKIWCTRNEVRQGLGNALEEESGQDTLIQAFTNGLIWQTPAGRFVLFNDGTWRR